MRSSTTTDTTLLLSSVSALGLLVMLNLPEVLRFLGHILADAWWFLGQIF